MSYNNLILKTESSKCLLCSDAPCAKSCRKGVPIDRIIRSVNFDNISGARITNVPTVLTATAFQYATEESLTIPLILQRLLLW